MTRWLTVINPAAGGGRCGKRAPAALDRLRAAGMELDVQETRAAGDATRLVREAYAEGRRHFLAVGGDGTSYEIVNGLFPEAAADRPTVGMLPLGTGNSFLRDFGVTSADEALRRLENGGTRGCDVVKASHVDGELHFINLLSVGFTAEAGDLTNRRFKPLGPVGYVAATLITASRLSFPVFPVRVDDTPLDDRPCVLLSFSNSRFTAGTMMMAPDADATDGELDVIRIGEMGRLSFVGAFPSIFQGKHVQRPEVEQRRAKVVDLELPEAVDVMVDGEVARLQLQRLEVMPGALEVVA
ncbi:MAG: diacylglycerol kinase family protein [Sandaracinaceae bacterium]